MQPLLSTVLNYVNDILRPLILYNVSASSKMGGVLFANVFPLAILRKINIASNLRLVTLRYFYKRVQRIWVFTKNPNPNKLYIDSNNGIFLSPGIVLKFMNLDQKRFLKKRLKTWHSYPKALHLLQHRPFIMHISDLYGKKSIFLGKLRSSGIKISWLAVRLFFNKHALMVKKARRIKRWIKKKYYQLGVGESR